MGKKCKHQHNVGMNNIIDVSFRYTYGNEFQGFSDLELDEHLKSFPLLKSREKLYDQDQIWEKICKDLNWEFIKSI